MPVEAESLFDLQTDQSSTEPPECRMCARPAKWVRTRGEYGEYCNGHHCTNRYRICHGCRKEFNRDQPEAGNKYCSNDCKRIGYALNRVNEADLCVCAWCGVASPNGKHRGNKWPYVCSECLEPIKHVMHMLKNHRVPHERAQQLAQHPYCEVCGQNVVLPRIDRGGKKRPLLVVDHEHGCCPGDKSSCGACVRGLLCRGCNTALGMLRDDVDIAMSVVEYLERTSR